MNSLKSIQAIAKAGKIISKILFIFCIVGFCICAVGIVSLALGAEIIKIGDITIHGMIEENIEITVPLLYAAMALTMLMISGAAIVIKFAEIYFKNELADGEPFTFHGAKELFRLGIITIVVPPLASLICSLGISIASSFYPEINSIEFDNFSSFWIGVMIIIHSLLCRYGAEIKEKNKETQE